MKKLALNSVKRTVLALSVVTLVAGSLCQVEAKSCDMRSFNIKIAEKVSTNEILNQLSSECGFSVITKDSYAKEKLDEKLYGINIKDMALNEIFDVLVASKGLAFDYNKKVLKVSGLMTKTFKVDYVTTEREGRSNTDISLSGDSGGEGQGEGAASSLSTGATIVSSDKFSFWTMMEKEISAITNVSTDSFKAEAPVINKEAGLVTVSGTPEQLQRVESYIETMMNRLHKQVLIDVKILSVSLDNSKQTGVNWGELYKLQNVKIGYESVNTNDVGTYSAGENPITDISDNGIFHANFMRLGGSVQVTDVLKFLKSQGDVTSISNPKVVTMSNQPAVFSSGDQLYYKLSASARQTGAGAATESYNNEVVKSVFAGVLLDITPQITDDGEIILKINPSISSVKNEVQNDGVRRLPPDLMKKQISSVVKLRDGEKIVLGGLISSRQGKGSYKVPILGNIPLLGYAFKQDTITEVREELVIIITPHIISSSNKARNKHLSLKDLGYQGIK